MEKRKFSREEFITKFYNKAPYQIEDVGNFMRLTENHKAFQSELSKLKYRNFSLMLEEQEDVIKKGDAMADFSNWSSWSQYSFVRTLTLMCPAVIKEAHINKNTIEFKTTIENFELLICIFKNSSLCQFEQLSEVAVIDLPTKFYRFKLNYILFSLRYNTRIIVSLKTTEFISIPTSSYLYNSGEWLEREVWDLYGIKFHGNTDLRRILTDYGFNGHPLRKDFPLTGFVEIGFNDEHKRILYTPVKLNQAYRVFSLNNPWIKY
jgi:NADH-quinone oxidoreductase subunit C